MINLIFPSNRIREVCKTYVCTINTEKELKVSVRKRNVQGNLF